jgi:hypothetical protein
MWEDCVMAQSSRGHNRKSSTGTVTVIEARVHRSSARNARVAFILTAAATAALSMVVASQWMQPILSLLLGIAVGLVCGVIVWAAVRVWPVVRLIWWWTGELLLAAIVIDGWVLLNQAPLAVIATVLALMAGAFVLPAVRRTVAALGWCFIVRHRLRTCFAQFIVSNQSGSLPLILLARPTPVGERVWIYLRPGLSPSDLESRLEKIAVACHASAVLVERASSRTAGFVRVDIKRREVLGGLVGSPLNDPVNNIDLTSVDDSVPVSPAPAGDSGWARPGMDLPDITPATTSVVKPEPARTPAPAAVPPKKVPASVTGGTEDYSDWLDD